ncbi:hypothetical protein P3L10_030611 [Capsicum annuum]
MTCLRIQKEIVIACKIEIIKEFVMERLLDIVHVKNTSALSLKDAIVNLLSQNSLSLSYVRGQCYDGASNMISTVLKC